MTKRSILKKQDIKRRRPRNFFSTIWRTLAQIWSFSIKSSCMLVLLVFISLLFLYLYEYIVNSPYVKLEEVVITGIDGNLKQRLLTMAEIGTGTSLLALNENKLKQKMESHPWIKAVQLKKRFPHTLLIWAEKEDPWAVVVSGGLHYLGRGGKVFKEVDHDEAIDYPLITGVSLTDSNLESQLRLATQILKVIEREKRPWSLEELSEIHVKKNGRVSLYFQSLPAAIQLNGMDLAKKMVALKRLVGHLNRAGYIHLVKVINLDYRNGAVVSFKKG